MNRLIAKMNLHSESGVAMMTAIIVTAVLMVLGGAMYFVASREENMSHADLAGNQAFYYAEGGLEAAINIISTEAATEYQLTQLRPDDSDDGVGYLMDPDPSLRQNPTDPLQIDIGKETYTVWVDTVNANGDPCTNCGLNLRTANPAYLLITAEGQSDEGYRKVQQRVRIDTSGYPLTFYIDGDVRSNGTPLVSNQSMYVKGNVYGRDKITVTGEDLIYGGGARVLATEAIYAKSNGNGSQIYTDDGLRSSYWLDDFYYDRDSRGPAGKIFTLTELEEVTGSDGLSATQLDILRNQAESNGFYEKASGNVTVQQSDLPQSDGNVVIFVEFPNGDPMVNLADLKFTWPPPPSNKGNALIIVLNGSVKMTGTDIGHMQGVVYCPDGDLRADGSGNGDFTGFVWGKGMACIGNFPFFMDEEFLKDAPFFAWTVTRENSWVEIDR